jgi:hypothetical protein
VAVVVAHERAVTQCCRTCTVVE